MSTRKPVISKESELVTTCSTGLPAAIREISGTNF